MTLILTAVCDEFVVQVSDRRLINILTGRPVEDEANKQIVVKTPKMHFVAGYTGPADVVSAPDAAGKMVAQTRWWLAETMGKYEVLSLGIKGCVDAVRVAADAAFQELALAGVKPEPLTVVFAGYESASPVPIIATITNCDSPRFRPSDVAEKFIPHVRPAAAGRDCDLAGCTLALPEDTEDRLRAVLKKRDYGGVTEVAVQQIRKAAKHRKFGKYVGENCMSICLMRDGHAEAIYHPTHGRAESSGPTLVESQGGDAVIVGAPTVSVVGADGRVKQGPMPDMLIGPSGMRVRDRRALRRRRPPTP